MHEPVRNFRAKEHRFVLVVKTGDARKGAELAVLCAFAQRKPDNCEFFLKSIDGHKETWMAGARAGTETTFDLIMRSLENMRESLGIDIPNAQGD